MAVIKGKMARLWIGDVEVPVMCDSPEEFARFGKARQMADARLDAARDPPKAPIVDGGPTTIEKVIEDIARIQKELGGTGPLGLPPGTRAYLPINGPRTVKPKCECGSPDGTHWQFCPAWVRV